MYQFGIVENKFYTAMDHHAWLDRITPLQSACVVNGTECYDGLSVSNLFVYSLHLNVYSSLISPWEGG